MRLTAAGRRVVAVEVQKDNDGAVEFGERGSVKEADAGSDVLPGNGEEFIGHQPARRTETVALIGENGDSKKLTVDIDRGERTAGNRLGAREAVILKDRDWPRLTGVVGTACDRPDFAAIHGGLFLAVRTLEIVAVFGKLRKDRDGVHPCLEVGFFVAAGGREGLAASLGDERGRVHIRQPDFVETHSLARRCGAAGGDGCLLRRGARHGFSLEQKTRECFLGDVMKRRD